jgi:hypothetical protein
MKSASAKAFGFALHMNLSPVIISTLILVYRALGVRVIFARRISARSETLSVLAIAPSRGRANTERVVVGSPII